MKYIAILTVTWLIAPILNASELEMKTVFLPLYASHAVVNEGEEPLHAKPRAISFLSRGSDPETALAMLKAPFVPHHDNTWTDARDANVISTCRLSLTYVAKKLEDGGYSFQVTLDTSSLARPEGFTLSDAEVVELAKQAIALNFPSATVVIKNGESGRNGD